MPATLEWVTEEEGWEDTPEQIAGKFLRISKERSARHNALALEDWLAVLDEQYPEDVASSFASWISTFRMGMTG